MVVFLYDIFKVIYSPVKAFREVLENPRYIGPVLIIILSLFLTIGTQYVSASRHYLETTTPPNPRDTWTNMTNPSSLWTTNASSANVTSVSNANSDLLAGNYSVRAFVSSTSYILLKTTGIGTVNCSDSEFTAFYYKLMYTAYNQTQAPENASSAKLRLFSLDNESDYFEFDLKGNQRYLNESQVWVDANVTLISGWTINGSPSWANITGIEFILSFPQKGQLSLYLNDLYFGGKYQVLYEAVGFSYWLPSTVVGSAFDIFLKWVIFAALLWLTVRVFQPQGGPFKTFLIVVGYAFAITFLFLIVDMLSVSQLPPLHFSTKVVFPLTGREIQDATTATDNIYAASWTSTLAYNVFEGAYYVSHVWTIGLFSIGMKTMQNFSWKRAIVISIVAYVMGLFVRAIIPI